MSICADLDFVVQHISISRLRTHFERKRGTKDSDHLSMRPLLLCLCFVGYILVGNISLNWIKNQGHIDVLSFVILLSIIRSIKFDYFVKENY